MASAAEFYDGLAADYDRLFADWWSAALWHGSVVGAVLATQDVHPPASLLDFTCGIGTQALSLASLGYSVTGTDISEAAIERARVEAAERGLRVPVAVADVRQVRDSVAGTFDAAITCDNALPHLISDEDLEAALRSVRSCLHEDGLFLASIRDYDELAETRPDGVPISMHGALGERHASGQAWRWAQSGDRVDITLFTLVESADGWRVSAHETTYRVLRRASLTDALRRSGFDRVRWLMPPDSGYYQPIVVARAAD